MRPFFIYPVLPVYPAQTVSLEKYASFSPLKLFCLSSLQHSYWSFRYLHNRTTGKNQTNSTLSADEIADQPQSALRPLLLSLADSGSEMRYSFEVLSALLR